MSPLALLCLLAVPARAHDYPIKPVSAILRIEPDRVVVDINSDSVYWIEEVTGLHPMPPTHWPADARDKTERYVNDHLRLSADGAPLRGRLISSAYIQRPWQVNEDGTFQMRVAYPPVADGANLSGEVDFFEDYRQERLEEKKPIPPSMDFRTELSIPSHHSYIFELQPGRTVFSVPARDARRTRSARLGESLWAGVEAVFGLTSAWAALAALALSLVPAVPSPGRRAAILLPAFAAAVCPFAWPGWLAWAAGAACALSAGRWLPERASPWIEAAACAALGGCWSKAALPWLPRAQPGFFERGAAAAGAIAAMAALIAVGLLAVAAERRNLAALSESRAAELFGRRRRLAATALLIVSGYGLAQALRS